MIRQSALSKWLTEVEEIAPPRRESFSSTGEVNGLRYDKKGVIHGDTKP